jgi:hypothetical protein
MVLEISTNEISKDWHWIHICKNFLLVVKILIEGQSMEYESMKSKIRASKTEFQDENIRVSSGKLDFISRPS